MEGPSVMAARAVEDEVAANEAACHDTALRNGFTVDQANNCDDGDVGCADCPWAEGGE